MTSPLVSISGLEKRFDLSGSLLEQITFCLLYTSPSPQD